MYILEHSLMNGLKGLHFDRLRKVPFCLIAFSDFFCAVTQKIIGLKLLPDSSRIMSSNTQGSPSTDISGPGGREQDYSICIIKACKYGHNRPNKK